MYAPSVWAFGTGTPPVAANTTASWTAAITCCVEVTRWTYSGLPVNRRFVPRLRSGYRTSPARTVTAGSRVSAALAGADGLTATAVPANPAAPSR